MKSLLGAKIEVKSTKKIGKVVDEIKELERYVVEFENGNTYHYFRNEIKVKRENISPKVQKITVKIEQENIWEQIVSDDEFESMVCNQSINQEIIDEEISSGVITDDDLFGSIPESKTESKIEPKTELKSESKTKNKPSYAHKRITSKRSFFNGTKSYSLNSRSRKFNSWHKKCQFRIITANFKFTIRP